MNKNENLVYFSGIGTVKVVRNRRAKNLSIRINQQGEVRMTVPGYLSRKRAEAFLISKKPWIMKKLEEMGRSGGPPAALPNPGDRLVVRGISIPIDLKNNEGSVEEAIWRILREEAMHYLPGRVKELAEIHGFTYSGLKIRKMKTRWGSCSTKDSINLNSWLMMLPDQLADYVILHELMHTRHRNHGRDFWEALDRVTDGSSKKLRKELQEHRILSIDPENQFCSKRQVAVGPGGTDIHIE